MEVVDQRHTRAGHQRETEHDVEPEHVEQRQHGERDVVGADAQAGVRLHLLEVREQRSVREHRGFRRAGRTRGEQQHREIARVAIDRHERIGRELIGLLGVVDHRRDVRRALRAGPAREVGERRGGHDDRGFDDGKLAGQLERRRRRVDGDGDAAGGQGREVDVDEGELVPRQDHDALSRPDTGREMGRQATGVGGEGGETCGAGRDERERVGGGSRRLQEDLTQVHAPGGYAECVPRPPLVWSGDARLGTNITECGKIRKDRSRIARSVSLS